jgi:hypothetical protein
VGSQIAIAQSVCDERDANEWLLSRFDLLSLPRFTNEAHPELRQLGQQSSEEQVLFLKDAAQDILRHWVRCEPMTCDRESSRVVRYHLYPKDLACIEFTQTTRLKDGRVIGGRYYLDTGIKGVLCDKHQREIRKVMRSLASWIKRMYPRRSSGRWPIFVGPALAADLTSGKARLVHGDGTTAVELE